MLNRLSYPIGAGHRSETRKPIRNPNPFDLLLQAGALEYPEVSMLSFEECVERIEQAYLDLGHPIGWRFLSGPRRTFSPSTRIAFLTLNPGGDTDPYPEHPQESSEPGSAYWMERWKGKPPGQESLQVQVQSLFQMIREIVGAEEISARAFVESRVLTGHFIPFRSPDFNSLVRPRESIGFSRDLWADILAGWMPQVLVAMSGQTFGNLRQIVLKRLGGEVLSDRKFETGWGTAGSRVLDIRVIPTGGRVKLAQIPHLSRYSLFSRQQCYPFVRQILDYTFNRSDE